MYYLAWPVRVNEPWLNTSDVVPELLLVSYSKRNLQRIKLNETFILYLQKNNFETRRVVGTSKYPSSRLSSIMDRP